MEGWTVLSGNNASATIGWSAAVGNPDPGAILFDATSGNGLIGEVLFSSGSGLDLRGRTLSAWALLTTSQSVTANFIAANTLTSTGFGTAVPLTPGTWTCVSFTPDTPDSALSGYDSSQIRWIGIQASGDAPFRVYFDQIEY